MGDGIILIGKAKFSYSRGRKYNTSKEAQVQMLIELEHGVLTINQRCLIRSSIGHWHIVSLVLWRRSFNVL